MKPRELIHGAAPATTRQIDYINLLRRQGHLHRGDFADSREFYRKRTMERGRAHELIVLGTSRRTGWRTGKVFRRALYG